MRLRTMMLLTAIGFTADALWRRGRAARLVPLPPSDEPVAADHRFVTAEGVVLDEPTRRAASAYATKHRLQVLDLVPAGLDSLRAMELVRRIDPAAYRADRLIQGMGGGHAVLVDAEVAQRASITRFSGLTAAEMEALAVRLKLYAPVRTDLAVASGLALTATCTPVDRRAILRRRWHGDLPVYLSGNMIGLAVLGAGLVRCLTGGERAGWAALVAACAQPYLATVGTPLRPHDRRRFALTRPVAAPLWWLRVAAVKDEPDPEMPRLRREYAAELAAGTERFYEARRTDCPWCGGRDLRRLLTSGDWLHHRPGRFTLDRCGSCGHVFQNPRLNAAGLEFHYRDVYDGLGEPEVERGFRLSGMYYRARAGMLRGHATPKSWLDVGGGHGHFCNAVRDIWPDTRFDILDMNSGIEEAKRRSWVDDCHVGFFPELADKLRGAYDVVSMHHYLEHTLDPKAELDAAVKVLPPGGHLLIEVPDPEWVGGRIAGRLWHAWFQPQHLNFVPVGNLVEALAERGFRTVAVERGAAHQPIELLMVVMILAHRAVPDPAKPWRRTTRYRRLKVAARTGVYLAASPLMLTAAAADQLLYPIIKRGGRSNAYRVLAQRTADDGDSRALRSVHDGPEGRSSGVHVAPAS
jgi:SAM-dependent methyltransferase